MPLSLEEQRQLKDLLQRAEASKEEYGFTVIPDEILGAMSDGSKRREVSSEAEPASKRGTHEMPMSSYATVAEGYKNSPLNTSVLSATPYEKTHKAVTDLHLPPQISDSDLWGRTIIEFGQYAKANVTYAEMYERTDERAITYKKWCRSRAMSATGQLADFAKYLLHMHAKASGSEKHQGIVIPGTSMVRRFK